MRTLYSGGALFDGTGPSRDGQGVLIADGRVERVAPIGEFAGFEGDRVDTAGATLMPGLIDCHVHLCLGAEGDPGTSADKLLPGQTVMKALDRAQATLAGGITAIRDCGGKDFLEFAVRDACNDGRQIGPTIRASGRVICMTGGHGSRSGRVADGVDDVIKAVREQIHAGSDLVKIMALARSKKAIWQSLDHGLESGLDAAYRQLELHADHPDQIEGPTAFFEKRRANWAPFEGDDD